ncbi:MAG: hypothetical protein ACTHKZ_06075, partial [Lysobacteraceae bacterium]
MSVRETPRLRLRLLHEDGAGDGALYAGLYADPAVMACIAPPLCPDAAARAFGAACRHNRAATPGHRTWRIDARAGTGTGTGTGTG